MGFDLQTTRFLFEAKNAGVDFSDVVTLGRQNLHISKAEYSREAARFGLAAGPAAVDEAFSAFPYAEGLLKGLGAQRPSSLDASEYEGATDLADMNRPLPAELANRYSAVIDGGTLEHIFDFRQAAVNIGKMLKVGGHLVSVTCANNFLGHGFYQFSPELFFRVFGPENGFEVESLVLTEVNADGDWYEVSDPAKVRSRVTLVNNALTYIMTRARKVSEVEMFLQTPQQSDYSDERWNEDEQPEGQIYLKRPAAQKVVETYFPRPARQMLRRLKQASRQHFDSPHLRRVRTF